MVWNFNQNLNRELPHFNRFGVLSRAVGKIFNTTAQQHSATMESSRIEIEQRLASQVLSRGFGLYHRYDITLSTFLPKQNVLFHHIKYLVGDLELYRLSTVSQFI